jgi:hypothetical protein
MPDTTHSSICTRSVCRPAYPSIGLSVFQSISPSTPQLSGVEN